MLSWRRLRVLAPLLACALAQGCFLDRSGTRLDDPPLDAGGRDAGALDAAATDAGPPPAMDAGPVDDAGDGGPVGDDAGTADAGMACAPWPWTPTDLDPCGPVTAVDPELRLEEAGRWVYDTDTGQLESPSGASSTPSSGVVPASGGGAARRVVSVAGLFIGAAVTLRVTGSAAPVLVVHGSATIDGTIDVSAAMDPDGSTPGPGAADPADCSAATPGMDATGAGAGGGGGGGYGADGGDGGDGDGDGRGAKGSKGGQSGSDELDPLRGGCPGAPGGAGGGGAGGLGGAGGAGGGAVHLAVRDELTLRGRVLAAGAGGHGGERRGGGGGGGGSGGGVLIEADEVVLAPGARVCANGGSGGEGADGSTGARGEVGSCDAAEGATTARDTENGGRGGAGGHRDSNSGNGDNAGNGGDGGGGGGGGTGRIRLRGASVGVTEPAGVVVSPTPRTS